MRLVTMGLLVMLVAAGFGVVGAASAGGMPSAISHPGAAAANPARSHSWSQIFPAKSPSDRDQVQMAYDPLLNEVVLFGGYDPYVQAEGDTWIYHNGTWKDVTRSFVAAPPARWAGGFVYDPQLHGLVLFGGRNLDKFFHDTWFFDSKGWHLLTTTSQPSARSGVALAYDPIDQYLLMFGGGRGNVPAGTQSPWTFYNDTWVLDRGVWHQIASAPFPPRFSMHAVYDPIDRYMLLTGGNTLSNSSIGIGQNDTWSFLNGTWHRVATVGHPPAMAEGGCFVWDTGNRFALLFGGEAGSNNDNQTWTYHGGKWTNLTGVLSPAPASRGNCGLAYDSAGGYAFMFAGDTPPPNYTYRNDSWSFK